MEDVPSYKGDPVNSAKAFFFQVLCIKNIKITALCVSLLMKFLNYLLKFFIKN